MVERHLAKVEIGGRFPVSAQMKTVVVTGASRGIGRAIAQKFLDEGWRVIGTSRDGTAVIEDPHFTIVPLDLTDAASISAAVQRIGELAPSIDVLVNNAGVAIDEEEGGVDMATLRETLETNLIGVIDVTNRLQAHIADGGRVVNISSDAGSLTKAGTTRWWVPSYRISKAALNMYTKQLALALQPRDIAVLSFSPGWVRTDMGGDTAPRDPSEPAAEIYALVTRADLPTGQFWEGDAERNW